MLTTLLGYIWSVEKKQADFNVDIASHPPTTSFTIKRHFAAMAYFMFFIAADRDGPKLGGGVIKADNIQAAVALVDHPDVNVCPLMDDFLWPKGATGPVVWDKPPLS